MAVLRVFIVIVFIGVSQQELDIASDLTPEDCFALSQDYNPADVNFPDVQLPHCQEFKGSKKCNKYHNHKTYKDVIYRPTSCAKDGNFGAKQCKGERTTGRCFCFNKEGYRIFGEQWWPQADNMTCACSRKKAEMSDPKSNNYIFFNSMHCDSMGNYEPLQCDVVSGQCWCVEEQTGDLRSPIVPQVAMTKLPCYNSLSIGTQYLRQCDNKKFGMENILYKLGLHGTAADFGVFVCDDDGAYGPYAIAEGLVYCTWRDNTKLGSWSSGTPIKDTLNCNCARDTRIFADAGKQQRLQCGPTGNYQLFQGEGDQTYCIDPDGYRKSKVPVPVTKDEDCDSYISYTEWH